MAIGKKLNPLVKTRKIMLAATKAYVRSQQRLRWKDHTREEITTAWVEADNILLAHAKVLKKDELRALPRQLRPKIKP